MARAESGLRRDAEANRQKIIVAAHALVAEHGLSISHDEIARAAGVAVGTVYRRFPDKPSLIAALFTDQVDRVVDEAEQALAVDDPWSAIVQFLTAILARQAESRGLRELSLGSPHGQELAEQARRRIAPVVRQLVQRGHDHGVLRLDATEQDLTLVPIMVGSIIQAARRVDPDLWRRTLAVVLDGLGTVTRDPLPGRPPSSAQLAAIMNG